MKKRNVILGYLLFVLTILFPLGISISNCFGYTFELVSVSVFAIVIALISIVLCFLSRAEEKTYKSGVLGLIFAILTPLSIVNAVFFMLESPKVWIVISVFIAIGCSAYLTIKHGTPRLLKIILCVISAILILPVGFMGFIMLIFGNIGQNTVVQAVESPNGVYYAEVIDSDQGALGGDTLVEVYENTEINLLIFKIFKNPQRVYHGEWGEFKNMEIYWRDDRCLVINSVEYPIE